MLTIDQKREILIRFDSKKYSNLTDEKIEIIFENLIKNYNINIPQLRTDSIPIKKVIKWNGFDIGVTHNPGDLRYWKTMQSGYGHIRGSYGKADDSKSIDVYIGDVNNPNLWKVRQLKIETGEIDEIKYFIGFNSAKQVKDTFCYHAGTERFGGVEKCSENELSEFRREFRNDGENITDDELMIEKLQEELGINIKKWLDEIYKIIKEVGSKYKDDESRQKALIEELEKFEFSLDAMTDVIYRNRILTELKSRLSIEEI